MPLSAEVINKCRRAFATFDVDGEYRFPSVHVCPARRCRVGLPLSFPGLTSSYVAIISLYLRRVDSHFALSPLRPPRQPRSLFRPRALAQRPLPFPLIPQPPPRAFRLNTFQNTHISSGFTRIPSPPPPSHPSNPPTPPSPPPPALSPRPVVPRLGFSQGVGRSTLGSFARRSSPSARPQATMSFSR